MFKVLHGSFVLLSRFAGFERSQIPPFSGLWIDLSGVQAVFPGFEFPDHVHSFLFCAAENPRLYLPESGAFSSSQILYAETLEPTSLFFGR
jgi:hypothetical protein